MVGDSPEDDLEGARALGMRAFLVDREDAFPDDRPDLFALPAALGLAAIRVRTGRENLTPGALLCLAAG